MLPCIAKFVQIEMQKKQRLEITNLCRYTYLSVNIFLFLKSYHPALSYTLRDVNFSEGLSGRFPPAQ